MVAKISFGIYKGCRYRASAISSCRCSEIFIPGLGIKNTYPGFLPYDQIHEEAHKLIDKRVNI